MGSSLNGSGGFCVGEVELLQIVVDKLGLLGDTLDELAADFKAFSELMGRVLGSQRFDIEAIGDDLNVLRRSVAVIAATQNSGDGLTDSSL